MAENREKPLLLAALAIAGFVLPKPKRRPRRAPPVPAAPETPVPRSWWQVARSVGKDVSDNGLLTQAAAITFYALLSIFPALAALVAVYGLVADPGAIVRHVNDLSTILPGGGQDLLTEELKSLSSPTNGGLTWALVLGIVTSLWTSNQATKALFNALNAVHEIKEQRGFFKLTAMTLGCTAGAVLFIILALVAVVVVPAALKFLGLGFVGDLVRWLRWPLMLVGVAALLAVLFRFGPCRSRVQWRWITAGSLFASLTWVAGSALFSWYVANFGSYNKTYGSLGAVVGFMTWIWLSSTLVLVGAQLDAELERRTQGQQPDRTHPDQEPVHTG